MSPSNDSSGSIPALPQPSQDSASLLKRLAGPSSGKAGLTKDQSEINRIIAEASKGSKYYENEKKKDKELTEKIRRILKERDDVLNGVELDKVEAHVDRTICELESQRDLSQIIIHVDMDAFFANVELLHNPELKGKPFGVGKGVLTTASYEARKFGVRSGMAGFIAKKLCPELILLPINGSRYSEMSDRVMAIFARYDPTMCPAGCDEGYLNITEYCAEHNVSPEDCVTEMRRIVHEETNLTVSAGIAPNLMLAKICSDRNKPNGQFHLTFESEAIKAFMKDLSIRKVPGIGRVNERLLESIGVKTCGDIWVQRGVISLLDKHFGLRYLLQTYLGIASNIVRPHTREERKSIGAERTFSPLSDKTALLQKLEEVAVELEKDMAESLWTGRTITLKYKLESYQVFTRAKSFDRWITKKEDLFATGKELLLPELPLTLRLIGLRVTKLKDLKASADPDVGIKRFFVDSQSARKRRKLDNEVKVPADDSDEEETELVLGVPSTTSINDHCPEDSEDDGAPFQNNESPRSRPRVSAPVSHVLESVTDLAPPAGTSEGSKITQVCPICAKTLQVDNQGLNAHVDFCLSRGAIREAQTEAGRSTDTPRVAKTKIRATVQKQEGWNWFLKDSGKGTSRSETK